MLFLAHQTGSLHILESFASTRIRSNKVKIKNTKNKFYKQTKTSTHAQVQICVFLKNLWFLTRILVALFVFGGKESGSVANSIYEKICIWITGQRNATQNNAKRKCLEITQNNAKRKNNAE